MELTPVVALYALSLIAVWALLFIRLLCFRTTLSFSEVAGFVLMGGLLGPLAPPLVELLVGGYGSYPVLRELCIATGRQVVLLGPVLFTFLRGRARGRFGVSDLFLAGFAAGLGFELLGELLSLATSACWSCSRPVLLGHGLLPPWQIVAGGTVESAGYAYWTGLLSMTLGNALRRKRMMPALLAALVGLWALGDQTIRLTPYLVATYPRVGAVFGYTAWLTLALLCVLLWREGKAPDGSPETLHSALSQSRHLLAPLLRLGLGEFQARCRSYRQAKLARSAGTDEPSRGNADYASVESPRPGPLEKALWAGLGLTVYILPILPLLVHRAFWSVMGFGKTAILPPLATLLLIWVMLRRPDLVRIAGGAPGLSASLWLPTRQIGVTILSLLVTTLLFQSYVAYLPYYTSLWDSYCQFIGLGVYRPEWTGPSFLVLLTATAAAEWTSRRCAGGTGK